MIGYFEQDDKFVLETPKTPRNWTNRLFNDNYVLELNQTMQGDSKAFINYDATDFIKKQRHFYIKDEVDGMVFCPLYTPLKVKLDSFRTEYGMGTHKVISNFRGIETQIRAFVPVKGFKEFWTITVKNTTDEEKKLSIYSVYSFEDFSFMGSNATFEDNYICKIAYPSAANYEETLKNNSKLKYVYAYCDKEISSYETNKYRFYGCEDETEIPVQIENGHLGKTVTQGMESILAAFENKIILKPGEEYEVNFILGVTVEKEEIKQEIKADVQQELCKVEALWKKRCDNFMVNTGNKELDILVNYWFKKQVTYLSRTNRLDCSSPVRNELQDTMGYAFCEPIEAVEIVKRVMKRQYMNGYIKQWNIHNGPPRGLATLRHSDAPLWLIACFIEIISYIIKDESLYEEKVGYIDSDEKESIWEHLKKAAYFMSSREEIGAHGLCLMRDGDWTDPMNGVGRLGRGESVWNSMFLVYCIKEMNKICYDEELAKRADMMSENINKYCWDGEWYLAAYDDFGRKVGTDEDEEGKIFLNTQTWAIISGVAEGERLEKVKKSLEKLKTSCGYRLSDPAFSKWNEKWGKISIKQMGALENGAVYCHGTAFKAFADYILGDNDSAMETVLSGLPTNPQNPPEKNMQLPLYLPNYYFGIENENFGRSSCVYNTGTTTWVMVILNRMGF